MDRIQTNCAKFAFKPGIIKKVRSSVSCIVSSRAEVVLVIWGARKWGYPIGLTGVWVPLAEEC